MTPSLFLSHSSKDKAFARKLDVALSKCGVEVFLDERSISVGQSIPRRVHDGIESSTHFLLVISAASNSSSWVMEELDAAKMRALSDNACSLIPVRIEDVPLPSPVRHIKYADFLNWNEERAFNQALVPLLTALGVSRPTFPKNSVGFLLRHSALVLAASLDAARIEYVASGLITMALHGVSANVEREHLIRSAGWTLTYCLNVDSDFAFYASIEKLAAEISSQFAEGDNEALQTMNDLAQNLMRLLRPIRRHWQGGANDFVELQDAAHRFAAVIESNLHEAISTTYAGYSSGESGNDAQPCGAGDAAR